MSLDRRRALGLLCSSALVRPSLAFPVRPAAMTTNVQPMTEAPSAAGVMFRAYQEFLLKRVAEGMGLSYEQVAARMTWEPRTYRPTSPVIA